MSAIAELWARARFARGLVGFLRTPVALHECGLRVGERLADREGSFLRVLAAGVYANPRSPYRALLRHAGVELGDVERLVADEGVEGALGILHDEGVRVTLEEFKLRRPIVRPGLELRPSPEDFDSPFLGASWAASSSASRGATRRLMIDLDHLEGEALYHGLFVLAFELDGRPLGFWRPAPPGRAGLKNALGYAKLGRHVERWFSQSPPFSPGSALPEAGLLGVVLAASRIAGLPIPVPRHVPAAEAIVVARWLAGRTAAGTPAVLNAPASSGVRVCLAAERAGLDVSGTLFRLGGEPLTEAKRAVVERAGARAVCHYAMGELGRIGIACADGEALDDVHVATDKLAAIRRPREVGGRTVDALLYTTLQPSCPKLLLNVESDDYGVMVIRDCACAVGAAGLRTHLHTIRSYEKLTSEGMNFLAADLLGLVEEVLPGRFGGGPGDYQLVESERGGLPRVAVVVSPRLGAVDERAVVDAVTASLAEGISARSMMAGVWRDGGTLVVERREPHATAAAKILPLHVDGGETGRP